MNVGRSKLQRVLTTLLAFCLSFSLSVPTQAIAFAREQIVGAGSEQTQGSSAADDAVTSGVSSVTQGESSDSSTGGEKVDNGVTSDDGNGTMMASESIAWLAASDDGITVKTKADFDFTKKWNDNNDEGNVRPAASDFAQNSIELYYKIDGAGEWTKLTTSNMGNVGLTEMPTPTYVANAGSVSYKYILPSVITVTSSDMSVDKSVTWNYKEKVVDGYVDPADEFYGNNSTVMNTLLSDWNASVLWGDNDNLYNSRVSVDTVNADPDTYFEVYRYVSGKPSTTEKLDAKTVGLTVSEKKNGGWKTEFSNAPAFDENGNPYVYYIVDKLNDDGTSKLATDPTGIGNYLSAIRNVNNHATNITELYEGGTLQMVLDNMTEFKVTKEWEDGDDVEGRPNTKLYLYRISEGANHAIEDDAVNHANPVQGNDYQDISTATNVVEIDFPLEGTTLPMYDNQGHRYIYFALETGVTGDYKLVTDNSSAKEDEAVISFFDKIKNSDGFAKYVLNGGTITNDREATQTITATKQFTAEALQEMENTAVQYTLYKKTADGWVPATEDDIVTENGVKLLGANSAITADGKITTTIAGFKAEVMELSAAGPVIQKYDVNTGARMEYKYVETAMTVNGGEWVSVPFTIDTDGNVTYQTVNVGVVAPGIGDQKTTIYFSPVQVNETTINNVLESDVLVTIEKVWTDSDGNNISGDETALQDVLCTFDIYRNGEVFKTVQLSLANYQNDEWFWQGAFDRYDENGLEYTWMIKEVGITDPQGRTWGQAFEYQTTVDQQATTGDMLINRAIKYRNVINVGPGYSLSFDVQKEWLDDSDTIARVPITYGLYDLVQKKIVATGELSDSNNWFARFSYTPESEERVASEYVIVELSVGGVNVDLTDDYQTIRTKAVAGKNVDVSNRIGTVGNPEAADALYYVYNVYVSLQEESATSAEYLIDNQRDATLNMKLTKNWNVGDSPADLNAKFFVYRDGAVFDLSTVTVELSGATLTADGGILIKGNEAVDNKNTVSISGLDKFDNDGVEYHYALVESTLNDQVIVNNRVQIDGDSYVSSVSLNENETVIYGKAEHHSGDLYVWDSSNTKQETQSLNSYKVWRDPGTSSLLSARPDISFDVYRVSYAEDNEIEAAVEAGDMDTLTEVISQYANADHAIVRDRFWNTKYNDWCWGCDLGEVERYDANGYPYVYFLTERYTSNRGVYLEGYDNEGGQTPNTAADVTSTKEVFKIPSSDLNTTCLVMFDGTQKQYSKATVNYRYDTRTVSGRKIWHIMSSLLDIPDANKPAVKVNLYRSAVSIPELDWAYNQNLLEKYASQLTLVNSTTLNANGDGVYSFMFVDEQDGSLLQRYDEWGQNYYYYVFEDAETAQDLDSAYPSEDTQITATDFHITNVYSVNEPVEITINKTWQKNATENPDQLPAAPAKFELYAQAVDSQGNKIGSEILMSTATVKVDEDYQSSFTFKYLTEDVDANAEGFDGTKYETLPYYAANDIAYVYYVKEVSIPDGYTSNWDTLAGSSFANPVVLSADATHTGSIGAGALVLNEYGKSTSFKVSKTWNDDNAYGKNYRVPVTLTVSRSWAGNTVNGQYIEGGTDAVYCTVDLTEADLKTGTTNVWEKEITEVKGADGNTYKVQEYAPNGSKYVYKVTEEKATNEADQEKLENNYVFTSNGTAGTNTLKRVSELTANKLFTWANNTAISTADFAMLQSINAVPTAITFAVQRSDNNDAYQYVTSGDTRVASYSGDNVLKQTINITANDKDTLKATWQNLPQESADGKTAYTYRVVEILTWKNADGTTNDTVWYSADADASNDTLQATDKNYAPETGSVGVTQSGTTNMSKVYAFTNKIPTANIKLVKKWEGDNLNRDNTRPEKLYLTATSKINKDYSKDFELTKSATGTDEWTTTATLPKWDDSKKLTDLYTFSEQEGKNQNLFKLYTVAGDPTDDDNLTYTVTNKLTNDDRKLVNVSATKTFTKDSDVKAVTQTRVQFKIYVQAKAGTDLTQITDATLTQITDANKADYVGKEYVDAFKCVQEVPIVNNTGSVTWNGLNKYWNLDASEAGDPQRIVYVIQEDLLDEDGNVLDTHSYKASDNPKTPSDFTRYSEDNTTVEDVNAGTLTNELQTKSVQVTKTWANSRGDSFDAATVTDLVNKGALPKSITYGLQWYIDGVWTAVPGVADKSFSTIDLAKAGTTGVTWDAKVPQTDKSGNAIQYRVLEKSVSYDGSNWIDITETGAFDGNVGAKDKGVYSVTDFKANSSNTMSSGSISVSKNWEDEDNAYNDRANVTIKLYRDGALYDTQTLNANNNWSYTWANVPVYQSGTETYSTWKIEETPIDGYDVTYDPTYANTGFTVGVAQTVTLSATNTLQRTSIPAMKQWEDNANQDGLRPKSITFTVKGSVDSSVVYDGATKTGGTHVVTGSSTDNTGWSTPYTFENLPKYINGKLVIYTVDENTIANYTDTKTLVDDTVVHTNKYTPEVVTINAEKTWVGDTGYEDTTRPASITYTVKGSYTKDDTVKTIDYGTMTGMKADGYKASMTDLPKYLEQGCEVTYTVEEIDIPGYTKSEMTQTKSGNTYTFSVTNTMKNTTAEANKVWNDDNNRDGKRPASITYVLTATANGQTVDALCDTQTVTSDANWYYKWESLPTKAYIDKESYDVTYAVTEQSVQYYTTDTTHTANAYTFTNNHTSEIVDVPANKVWDDNSNQDGLRPASITYTLTAKANGVDVTDEAYNKTHTVTGSKTTNENWSYTFEDLYKYYNGYEVIYTVAESEVQYYEASTSGDMTTGFTFTNKHTPAKVTVSAEKTWAGDTGYENVTRPDSITYTVRGTYTVGDQTKSVETQTMTGMKADSYKASLTDLPKMAEGSLINYTVDEISVPGYDTVQGEKKTSEDGLTYTYSFTNTLKTTYAEADKTWDDKSNQDGVRPESITYVLIATANGQTVEALGKTQTVKGSSTTDDNWYYKWENLPTKVYIDKASYDVTYAVTETNFAPYEQTGAATAGNKTTFTNKHTPELTEVSAVKKWDGEVDSLKSLTRPDSITYKLTAKVDGQTVDALCKSATVTPADKTTDTGWDYTFEGLDKYHEGKLVAYTVTEVEVDGYSTTVEQSADGATFTFTNKVDYTEREADKVWDDASNQDGKRPLELTYDLKAEITVAGQAVEFKALSDTYVARGNNVDNTGWYHKWENLPTHVYSNGSSYEVTYTVTETGYDPYTQTDVKVDGNKTTFTNKYTPETVKVLANKAWANEVDSLKGQTRPDSLTYTLTGTYTVAGEQKAYTPTEAKKTAKPADKSKDENWGVEWTELPKYAPGYQGAEISYDLAEAEVTGYTTAKAGPTKSGTDTYGNTVFTVAFTNSLVTTGVDVEKVWADDDNRDALRPGDIVVSLHANGATEAFLGKTAKLNKDSQWKAAFTGLPKYFYEDGRAVEVAYTISEDEVPDWYTATTTGTASEGYIVTNTHEPFTTEVSVEKAWEYGGIDEALVELVMPESITFDLTGKTADGTTVYTDSYTAGAKDNWAHTFTDLPAYAEGRVGEVITYTVTEEPVAGFDTDVTSASAQKKSAGGVDEPGVLTYTYSFTNTLQVVDVDVTKAWEDDTDRDGLRPESVKVGLLESNKKFLNENNQFSLTLSGSDEENTWSGSFTKLPKYLYENGNARLADYSIEELDVPENYTCEITKTGASSYAWTATNTHEPYVTTVDVTKAWEDQDDLYGFRPGEITVNLIGTITVDESGDSVISDDASAIAPTSSNSDEKVVYQDQRTITANDKWSTVFADLPVYAEHGNKITYNVVEDEVAGYEGDVEVDSYTDDEGFVHFTFDFDNTQIVTKVDAEKVWDDQNNVDKIRPSSITFVLTGKVTIDGLETTCVTLEKSVGAAENWKASFENLPKFYTDGQEIVYTVTEKEVTSGYTLKVTGDAETGFVLTNTHVPPSKTAKTSDESAPLTAGLGMLGVLSMAALGFLRTRRKFEGRRIRA